MTTQAPDRVPARLVELAARLLPAEHRYRYRQEFLAELYDMPQARQVRHATQVLSRAWVLRAALRQPAPATIGEAAVKDTRPLRCRLNLWHTWRPFSTPDGNRYTKCARCGKERRDRDFGNTIGA
jgi:hypothetical protein